MNMPATSASPSTVRGEIEPRSSRGRAWCIAFAAALVLYRLSMAPGLLWGDPGEAQFHTLYPGWLVAGQIARSHVLFYACSSALARLPGFDAASAANTVSVLGGAWTIANLAWLLSTLCRRRIAVVVGTMLLAFAHTFWQHAAQAEMLTLTTALLTTEAMALVRLVETGRLRWVAVLALANGLGASNHNFALLMWPVYVLLALRFLARWREQRARAVILAAVFLLMGMLPILLLSVDYYRTHESLRATVKSFLVGDYAQQVLNVSRIPRLLKVAAFAVLLNFPTPLLLAAPIGLAAARKSLEPIYVRYLTACLLIFGAFGMRYDVFDQHTFLIPFFLYLSILMALGVDHILDEFRRPKVAPLTLFFASLAPLCYAAAPPILRAYDPNIGPMPTRKFPHRDRLNWFLRPWRTGYDGPERFARETLAALPQNAVLVVDSSIWPPLNYLQLAEGIRLDVRLDSVVAHQPWLPAIAWEEREQALAEGRLFSSAEDPYYQPCWMRSRDFRFEPFGHVFQVHEREEP